LAASDMTGTGQGYSTKLFNDEGDSVFVDFVNSESLYGSTANFAGTCQSMAGENHVLVHLCSSRTDGECTNTARLSTGLCSTLMTRDLTEAEEAALWDTNRGWKRLGLVDSMTFSATKTFESTTGEEVTEEEVRRPALIVRGL
jgi:hypothetical protein